MKPLKYVLRDITEDDNKRMDNLSKQGYTYKEIAKAYNISASNVANRIKKVRQAEEMRQKAKGRAYENIDTGKVFALRRAGWNLKDIGSEIHKTKEETEEIIKQWQEDNKKDNPWQEV